MSKLNKKQSNIRQFNTIPSILFILSAAIYLVGTFLPWYPGNIYALLSLDIGAGIFAIITTAVVAILAVMQIINCFAKRNWIRKTTGTFGILVNIVLWITILGSAVFMSKYGSIGVGAFVSAAGSILMIICSIVLLATNKKKNTNYH